MTGPLFTHYMDRVLYNSTYEARGEINTEEEKVSATTFPDCLQVSMRFCDVWSLIIFSNRLDNHSWSQHSKTITVGNVKDIQSHIPPVFLVLSITRLHSATRPHP